MSPIGENAFFRNADCFYLGRDAFQFLGVIAEAFHPVYTEQFIVKRRAVFKWRDYFLRPLILTTKIFLHRKRNKF